MSQDIILRLEEYIKELQARIVSLEGRLYALEEENKQLRLENQELRRENQELRLENKQLKEEIQHLRHTKFSNHKSERRQKKTRSKKNPEEYEKRGRKAIDASLPRQEMIHDLKDTEKECQECGNRMHRMGEETSEQIEIIPARVIVYKHRRFKYGCTCEAGVKIAPLPISPLEKVGATASTLSSVLVSHFEDHLPYYRQAKMWQRLGITLSRTTLMKWSIQCGQLLKPLAEALQKDLRKSFWVGMDETPFKALYLGKKGYIWVCHGESKGKRQIIYHFRESREGKHAQSLLEGFEGQYAQSDGYAGYHRLDVKLLGCWAHARRKLIEVTQGGGEPGLSDELLDLISVKVNI